MAESDLTLLLHNLFLETEERRIQATQALHRDSQKEEGQFFTPDAVAKLVASKVILRNLKHMRILDPGAGIGSLSVALISRILNETDCKSIELVLVEKDANLIPFLSATAVQLTQVAKTVGCEISLTIENTDFFDLFTSIAHSDKNLNSLFDIVIMNPPYGKIGVASPERSAMRNLGVDCSNLYSGFVSLSLRLLEESGSLSAITPRSFMNGPYFLDFRKDLLANFCIEHIHLFDSRSSLFSDTGVLQENVIFSGTKSKQIQSVQISTSKDHLDSISAEEFDFTKIVLPSDTNKFLRIPSSDDVSKIIAIMESLPSDLIDLGFTVSTGRVVDFRVKESLSDKSVNGYVPLIYPGNFQNGQISWPRDIRKPQSIDVNLSSLLLPNEIYVLIKRFSSKEERRRIVASVWEPGNSESKFVGFENHLNVIHAVNRGLPRELAIGLLYWLNSSLVDKYFRVFSGHTQVNATDIRSMKFPSRDILIKIGEGLDLTLPAQDIIDSIVEKFIFTEIAVA
jgi:adenine-specific DNA-methyltransferase